MFTISKVGNKIMIIPFNNKAIIYDKSIAFDVEQIEEAKMSGFWIYSKSKIKTKDNQKFKYSVTQGKKAVKQILKLMGF